MNKFWMTVIGIIAGIIALSNLGPIISLAFSGVIIYIGVHYYLRSSSTGAKIWWGFVAAVGAISAVSNVPAIIGVLAIAVLWYIYKKWNEKEVSTSVKNDPFTNFEREWQKLNK
ncbi:ABC transporter permease [Planococcus halotolerans]|uniref:ABC transporter permease n=1 Tax=Planococcus halotolerans TaxID=2233542 RepID=A0A365L6J9_9BACL|nr:ABC transporter permease [Planococcus halotolerans]RAZ80887.1 ABC transporter permease [Planococcus halotolerans]